MAAKQTSLIVTLVTSGTSAVVGLLVAFGVSLSAEQMAAIMTAAGFVGVVVALVLWSRTVDRSQVVERLIGETVVAGEANDAVPSGQPVRVLGELPGQMEPVRTEIHHDVRLSGAGTAKRLADLMAEREDTP